LRAEGFEIWIEINFAMEIKKTKQDFLLECFPSPQYEFCILTDIGEAGKGLCVCRRHRRHCRVKKTNLIVAGFSCKFLSLANNSAKTMRKTALTNKDSGKNTSFITFHGFLGVVDLAEADAVVIENLEEMEDEPSCKEAQSNLSRIESEFEDRDFEVQPFRTDTWNFALPETRRRMKLVALKKS
jgi:site-specific DNA-cytosine methylase